MASYLRQRSAAMPIHFFKIILETNVERIKLPNKFTKRHGGCLPNPVSLRPPDFKEWVVYWTGENGEVWFEKGWKEFVENYSLGYGYLVVFKYKGTSQIDVLILDQSALELDYLSSSNGSVNTVNVNTVNATEKEQEARPISFEFSSQPSKETRMWNVERDSNVHQVHADKGVGSDQGTNVQRQQRVNPTQSGICLNMPKTRKAWEITNRFKSKHPYFTLAIQQSKLQENATKYVPKFLDCMSGEKNVMLQMANRSWCVKLICGREKYDRFSSGWSIFAKESELEGGDICIFELINPAVPLLQVHIFKS